MRVQTMANTTANATANTTAKATRHHSAEWNSIVKNIRKRYPDMSDKAVYVRARYACKKNADKRAAMATA